MQMRKYELVLQGFCGGTDLTDDLLLTVETAMTRKELQQALNRLGLQQDIGKIVALPGAYSGTCLALPAMSDALVEQVRRLRDTPISVPRAVLAMLIDMADSHVGDIESGIDEGIYAAAENPDIDVKRRTVNAADSLYRQTITA